MNYQKILLGILVTTVVFYVLHKKGILGSKPGTTSDDDKVYASGAKCKCKHNNTYYYVKCSKRNCETCCQMMDEAADRS